MSTYAWVDLCAVAVPLLFSFHPALRFHVRWAALAAGTAVMMALFIPWDIAFTRAGVWGFEPAHTWPWRPAGLPLEEWLFFLCIPYASVFTYHCFQVLRVPAFPPRTARAVAIALMIALSVIALLHLDKAYTVTACAGCAIWLGWVVLVVRATWLSRFLTTYIALLLPFLVVNGVLTGTGLQRPVVWYADAEHLPLRLLTIPVEDVFYGLLMLGLVVTVYEAFVARRSAV